MGMRSWEEARSNQHNSFRKEKMKPKIKKIGMRARSMTTASEKKK